MPPMENVLNIFESDQFEEAITKKEYHTYQPYLTTTYDNNDEIRIPILSRDVYTLPSESFLYVEGTFDGGTGEGASVLVNNAYAFLFDELRYEINGTEIDKVKDVGTTSLLKNLASFTHADAGAYEGSGWTVKGATSTWDSAATRFSACIPLKLWLGFAEMYKKILINCKQELILLRARHDENICKGTLKGKVKLTKME